MFSIVVQGPEGETQHFSFDKDEVSIGRHSSADIQLKPDNVSKQHARIVFREGRYFIIDRKSTNGTFVNGKRVTAPISLKGGDKIFVGDFSLTFVNPLDQAKPKATEPDAPKPLPAMPTPADILPKAVAAPATPVAAPKPLEILPEDAQDASSAEQETIEPELIDETPVDPLNELRLELYTAASQYDDINSPDIFCNYNLDNEELANKIEEKLKAEIETRLGTTVGATQKELLAETLLDELLGFGLLEKHLDDAEVEEILVNGHLRVLVTRNGVKEVVEDRFSCEESLFNVTSRLMAQCGEGIGEEIAMVDGTLPDGTQVTTLLPPYSQTGIVLRLVKAPRTQETLGTLRTEGVLNEMLQTALQEALKSKKTILVTAQHPTDRLQLVQALASEISPRERLALFNAPATIKLPHEDLVRLSMGSDPDESEGTYPTADFLRHLDRLAFDRLIVPELREDFALEVLLTTQAGLAGSLYSIYGQAPGNALSRLERMIEIFSDIPKDSAARLIGETINWVVTVQRYPQAKGGRRIAAISEVVPTADGYTLKPLYTFEPNPDQNVLSGKFVSHV